MPHIPARDGTRLYYEEAGQGSPIVFVHEYAGDWRTWEPQMRFFSRAHRCVTFSSAAICRPTFRPIPQNTVRISRATTLSR